MKNTFKNKIHSPIPGGLEAECRKAADIMSHFVKGKTALDQKLIPKSILDNAKGIAIITILKAGFIWSGRVGTGLVVARLPDGRWSAPCAINAAGAGVGAQIGNIHCYYYMALNLLIAFTHAGNLTFGGNVSVAAGPVGRSSEGVGSVVNLAPIYSYSKSKGLFAGISLEGTAIVTRGDANAKFYNRKVTANEILTGVVEPPTIAEPLYRALDLKFSNTTDSPETEIPSPSTSGLGSKRPPGSTQSLYVKPQVQKTFEEPGLDRLSNTLPAYSSGPSPRFTVDGKRPPPPVPVRKKVKALFPYSGERESDLSFGPGDIIELIRSTDNQNDWWTGRFNGKQGDFPANYVEMI